MKSASVLSVLAAGTIAAISTSVCAGSNGTDAVMRSLDQVNRIYTPEKTTHTELLLRLNDLGCHYRVNNRMKADPEDVMKHGSTGFCPTSAASPTASPSRSSSRTGRTVAT